MEIKKHNIDAMFRMTGQREVKMHWAALCCLDLFISFSD